MDNNNNNNNNNMVIIITGMIGKAQPKGLRPLAFLI